MSMYIKLDDIDLIKRVDEEGATVEIRSVHEVQVSARRKVVELPVPGSQSNIFQDMGRDPRRVRLEGRLIGKAAFDTLKTIRTKFNSGDLIPFSSDIWAIEDITTVIFEGFSVGVHDGIPLEISYTMLLREAKPPPEEGAGEKGAPSQKGEAEKEVEEKTKEITKEKEGGKEEGKGEEKGEGKEEGKAEKPKEKEGAPEGKGELDKGAAEGTPKGEGEAGIKSEKEGGRKADQDKEGAMKGEGGKGPGEKEEEKGRGKEKESGETKDEGGASEGGGLDEEKGAEKSRPAKSEEKYAEGKEGDAAAAEDGGIKGGLFDPVSQDAPREGPKKASEKGK
ncbi:MAG: DNA circularization N-terminal domain-containing protein [Candidatus Methanosuratincola sp.]|jgi:hypothetical protein|nr:DNA circularization N-terminal domain-containing protein [Candidatus Methanosuratincola sp.]